jgi:uncharacterized membrane protein YccC
MNPESGGISREELMSALFAHMVMQQANLAMMLLGKVPHPQTGEAVRDLEAAKLFIDQLEMLELKTKGNLTKPEEQLLKQNLTALRMAFVEAVNSPAPAPPASGDSKPAAAEEQAAPLAESAAAADTESKKKFSKKY